MSKNNGKGGKKGKGPATKKIKKVIKGHKRTTWMLEQKVFACNLKRSGKRPRGIKKSNWGNIWPFNKILHSGHILQ